MPLPPSSLILMPLAQLDSTDSAAGAKPASPAPAVTPPAAATPANAGPAIDATSSHTIQPSATTTTSPDRPGGIGPMAMQLIFIVGIVVLFYVMLSRGQRKEEKRRKAMLSEMKKGDKIMTIGGMVARVVSIDGDEVVLKIDESANVKAVYKKSSIQSVIVAGDDKSK